MPISDETVIARGRDTAWQMVEDKAVVVTPRDRKIHILDGTGGRVWEFIEEPRTAGEIVKAIGEEFDVDVGVAAKETMAFLEELLEKGIVEVK